MDFKTIHGWFSSEAATHGGISIYGTRSGAMVGVTRVGLQGDGLPAERFVGEVLSAECGGCIWPRMWGAYPSVWAVRRRPTPAAIDWPVFPVNVRRTWN